MNPLASEAVHEDPYLIWNWPCRGAGDAEAFGARAAAADMTPKQLKDHLTFPQTWGPTEWGPISFLPDHDILVSALTGRCSEAGRAEKILQSERWQESMGAFPGYGGSLWTKFFREAELCKGALV